MHSTSLAICCAALVAIAAAAAVITNGDAPPVLLPPPALQDDPGNITAGYECNSDCTQCNATGSMIQGGCTWVPPAKMYVMYTCIENNTMVQLEAFGPLKFMCSSSDPLHLTYKYPVNQCVAPPAGGNTIYHCPA